MFNVLMVVFLTLISVRKIGEKGHVKPANYLDSHEKFLIGVATKGGTQLYPFVLEFIIELQMHYSKLSIRPSNLLGSLFILWASWEYQWSSYSML